MGNVVALRKVEPITGGPDEPTIHVAACEECGFGGWESLLDENDVPREFTCINCGALWPYDE